MNEATLYTRILHATDLKENHYSMCQQAVEISNRFDSELYLLHVIETPPSHQFAQGLGFIELINPIKDDAVTVLSILGEALGIAAGYQYVEIGSIKHHVLQKAQELGCGLIIMGSHSANHMPKFLGSTAHAIIYHAVCDVLI